MSIHVPQEWNNLVRKRSGVTAFATDGDPPAHEDPSVDHTIEGPKPSSSSSDPKSGNGSRNKRKKPNPTSSGSSGSSSLGKTSQQGAGGNTGISSIQDVCDSILKSINGSYKPNEELSPQCSELNLDYILSRIPYKQIIQDLFGSMDHSRMTSSVPVVSRSYEEQFMREPKDHTERPCVMGASCECRYIDKTNPFTAVEFVLPDDPVDQDPQMCVLCHRRLVQSLFHDLVYSGKQFHGVIQRYGNICGQPGEYAKEVSLVCPPSASVHCMPFPSVVHQRNRYTVVSSAGVRHIIQNRMSPEDF